MSFRDPSGYQCFSHNSGSFIASNSFNTDIRLTVPEDDDERPRILSWLSPLEPQTRHQDIRTRRLDNIGGWFLEDLKFQEWCNGDEDSVVLLCPGNPGAGKTYISSLVIDTLCDRNVRKNVGIACFYCDHLHTTTSVIGGLLKQLLPESRDIPKEVYEAFRESRNQLGGRGLRLPKLIELFQAVLPPFDLIFICIDALDECPVEHRIELLRSLREIVQNSKRLRLFLTGRPYIPDEVKKYLAIPTVVLNVQPSLDDITTYLTRKLDDDPEPDVMDDVLRAEIMTTIPRAFSKIFLLVALQIELILGEMTILGRREKLRQMGNGLGDAYAATLDRIRGQRGDRPRLGMAVLMWVSLAERPLRVGELCHALAVRIGPSRSADLDRKNVPLIQTLLGCCLGLVIVDEETSTVRLLHATLRDYLRGHPNLFHDARATMAEVCLTYLNFESVKNIPLDSILVPSELPFVRYASRHWGTHARDSITEPVILLALELLNQYQNHIASKLLFSHLYMGSTIRWRSSVPRGFTALHCVAAFGISELLVEVGITGVNERDCSGRTPLIYAAANGHEQVLKVLLDSGLNIADTSGQTPLFQAVVDGRADIVKILLGQGDLDPNIADPGGQTPLFQAVINGRADIIKALLGRKDLDPNIANTSGQTPLFQAVKDGEADIVKTLFDRKDLYLNMVDSSGRSPLSQAAMDGRADIVKILLGWKDVKPNIRCREGGTALYWATRRGYEEIIKQLVRRRDTNPNIPDRSNRTPLCWAARRGHVGAVELLLGSSGIRPDLAEDGNQTPLYWAAWGGHEEIVKLLLAREDVNPNATDHNHQTPLFQATANGYEGVARLLLDKSFVNPNLADSKNQVPLHLAAEKGNERLVQLFLNRNDVNPNLSDNCHRTPLCQAVRNNRIGVVKLLLSREDIVPSPTDLNGRSPLYQAAMNENEEIVGLFLDRNDVDPNIAAKGGQTPLHVSARVGIEGAVKLLLGREDVDPNRADSQGLTPLYWAVRNNREEITRLLLAQPRVDPNPVDEDGQAPLHWASWKGNEAIVQMLLDRTDICLGPVNGSGRTPLHHAIRYEHGGVVELLEDRLSRREEERR